MPSTAIRLTVSDIRQRIFEVSNEPSRGIGSLPGRLFHRVAECALTNGHPAFWQVVLTNELDADEWAQKLYQEVLGPDLTNAQSVLRESGSEVWQLWSAVRSFTTWFCDLLTEAVSRNLIEYDAQKECWRGAENLFEQECDLRATLHEPGWTAEVTVVGRADHLIRIDQNRWCVIEFKLGGGHAEADAAQACLYHELLGGGTGSAALVLFDGNPEPKQILLSAEHIGQARPKLMELIGSLAGVTNGQSSAPVVSGTGTAWPKQAREIERQQGARLIETLKEFNADASLARDPLVGPTFVRYLLEPARRVPAKRIVGQGANLQVRLQLDQEPMIGLAGGRIAVDVQRKDREFVQFNELRDRLSAERSDAGNSRVLAGIDLTGRIEFIDLAKDVPHLLVAGVPGSGKSEWLRTAIASLIVTNTPDTLRLILIDPKKNAFGELAGSSYLWRLDSLLDTPEGHVIPLLNDLIEEMKTRYDRFKEVSADNLFDYQRTAKLPVPRLVCVVDEYAELLMGTKKKADREQIEAGFVRIAQMGRAAGIHLMLATQRPSRQVVTGVLKANIPGRVALRVSTRIESGVVLDQSGAEFLLGRGDLLLTAGGGTLVRLQSAYLTEADRREIFRHE
ncbi:MAG: FtsK/SpoIIIE domain-containing protein [Rhodomicrobium sp.]